MAVYNLLLSATGQGPVSAAVPLISPGKGGTTVMVNPIESHPAPQSAGNVFFPIAIGFYNTEKIEGQVGAESTQVRPRLAAQSLQGQNKSNARWL